MASDPEDTGRKQDGTFKKGVSGNPAGRPKGARSELGESFLSALRDDFDDHGAAAIVKVREDRPDQYMKVIASLLPKDINLNVNDAESMTDDELIARIRELDAAIHPFLAAREGVDSEGAAAQAADGSGAVKHPRVH